MIRIPCPSGEYLRRRYSPIGQHYELEDVTMYVRREAFMLEFFAYQSVGGTLSIPAAAIVRSDFS